VYEQRLQADADVWLAMASRLTGSVWPPWRQLGPHGVGGPRRGSRRHVVQACEGETAVQRKWPLVLIK
jgi:hypothetical protein